MPTINKRHDQCGRERSLNNDRGTVQALLGHSLPEVMRQIYLRVITAEQCRAVEDVKKLLLGPRWTKFLAR